MRGALRHGVWMLPVLAVAAADVIVRHLQSGAWQARDWVLYGLSCAFALAWVRLVAWGLAAWRKRQRWLWIAALPPLGVVSSAVLILHFEHYRYFGVQPDVAALTHLFVAPQEALLALRDSLTARVWGLLAALSVALGAGWALAVSAFPWQEQPWPGLRRAGTWLTVLSAMLLAFPLRLNVPLAQGKVLPSVSLVFTAAAAWEALLAGRTDLRHLQAGSRPVLPALPDPPPFNVLVVIAESMRASSAGYDGNPRNTTPLVGAFFKQNAPRIVNFEHCYANSLRMEQSVGSLFTGAHPLQEAPALQRNPLMFQYAKMFRSSYAFLLSAQSYPPHLRAYLQSADLDQLLYQEISGQPRFNGTGMDDHGLLPPLQEILQGLPPHARFFGILHLMGSHYPYRVPPRFERWNPRQTLSAYDNSILYGDDFLGGVLALLGENRRLDDTLIVFTSDHGEAFGEHGVSGHARGFYEEMVHIPCWMVLPKSLRGSQRAGLLANRQRVVSNLDLVPTLVDLLGLGQEPPVPDILAGLWGSSLARAVSPQRVVVAANGAGAAQADEGFVLLRGTERLQYLGGEAQPRFRFTDLARDPGQTRNLWNTLSRPEQAQWRRILGNYPQLERTLLPLLNAAGPPR